MKNIKVTFKNGDYITTKINGTKEEIRSYYIGNVFNIGTMDDNLQVADTVEFLD